LVPSQLALPFAGGAAHGEQRAPQLLESLFAAQIPLQLCAVIGHPPQTAVLSMQAPPHSCWVGGQDGTQASPLHVTEPPCGGWHASQDVEPQVATSLLLTQWPLQAW